jgi:hypothetical protein
MNYIAREILGCNLLHKRKYVYLVEFAMQNIKLAFKSWQWFWFKKKIDYTAVWKQDTWIKQGTFCLSLVLNFG